MTKAQILTAVKELSGRLDLDETLISGETKGSFFLNAGLRFLDSTQINPEARRWLMKDIEAGTYKLQFKNCRSIEEVWIKATGEDRSQLEKKTLQWIKENYADSFDEVEQGTPLYYAVDIIHLAPQQRSLTKSNYTDEFTRDYHTIMFGASYGYKGIVIMPPPELDTTVEVLGEWYSILEQDTDQCYWSVQYPELLIQATLFAIEVFYRNSTGMQDILNAMQPWLSGIDKDMAAEEAADINQMEG